MMALPKIKSIIFDLDGVLIDSLGVMEVAYHSACKSVLRGQSYPPFSDYCKYLGRSLPEIIRILKLPPEICDSYIMVSYDLIDTIKAYPGVVSVLSVLRDNNIPMCVATGKDRARTLHILKHLELLEFFEIVICSDQVSKPKPAPEMANFILESLKWTAAETLFVGDAEADIRCGQAAGTQTALALWGNPDQTALRQNATFRIAEFSQLLGLVAARDLVTMKRQ